MNHSIVTSTGVTFGNSRGNIGAIQPELVMEHRIGVALVVGLIAAAGCDRKPDAPVKAPEQKVSTDRPTTQELTQTPFTTLSLMPAGIPATIQVPTGWALTKEIDPANLRIEGYTPTDVADIGFMPMVIKTAIKRDVLIETTKQQMAADPLTATIPATRESNGALVIESIDLTVPPPSTEPTSPGTGASTPPAEPAVQWSVMLVVPNHDQFSVYELRLIGLTRTEFKTDRDFLQKIMGSLNFDPPTGRP
jgi:hypothetical protein